MTNSNGVSPHVNVPADQPVWDVTDEATKAGWKSVDPKAGVCAEGNFGSISSDWPSTDGWVQA